MTDKRTMACNTIMGICESDLRLTSDGINRIMDFIGDILQNPLYCRGTAEQIRHEELQKVGETARAEDYTFWQIQTIISAYKMSSAEVDRYFFGV